MKLTNIAEIKEAISDINTNMEKMTADKVAQRIDQIKRDLSEINDAAKKETEKAFAELAAKDVREFWEKFLSDRSYCAYTIQQSGTAYNVKELQRVVLFNAIDRQYKAIMDEKEPEKTTIAVDMQYFRTLSHFTHNVIRSYAKDIEATNANDLALNEKSKTEIAGVDFKSCTIAAMEKQANAVLRCLIPSELVGETSIRRADIRQILASSGNTAKIDFARKTKDATVKMKAENGILNDLLTAFTMRKAGGNYKEGTLSTNPDLTLYVHKGTIVCQRNRHHIEQAVAILSDKYGEDIRLNVSHCLDCQKFFIHYNTYQLYRKRYNVILGDIKMIKGQNFTTTGTFLADESPLRLCGYSVGQQAGLHDTERQAIITHCIERGIMTKGEVIRLLNWFMEMNGKKKGNELARMKWRRDLDFVLEYRMEQQSTYRLNEVKRYKGNRFISR